MKLVIVLLAVIMAAQKPAPRKTPEQICSERDNPPGTPAWVNEQIDKMPSSRKAHEKRIAECVAAEQKKQRKERMKK